MCVFIIRETSFENETLLRWQFCWDGNRSIWLLNWSLFHWIDKTLELPWLKKLQYPLRWRTFLILNTLSLSISLSKEQIVFEDNHKLGSRPSDSIPYYQNHHGIKSTEADLPGSPRQNSKKATAYNLSTMLMLLRLYLSSFKKRKRYRTGGCLTSKWNTIWIKQTG